MAVGSKKLNLGCGRKKLATHLNVDRVRSIEPDLVHDLNCYPYPFEDGRFEEICAYDVVEHLDDLVAFMSELRRIVAPHGRVLITTPHFSSANGFTDPTHQRQLGYCSFDYFTSGHALNFYGTEGFAISYRRIIFARGIVNRAVSWFANRLPLAYERRWAWVFPAWFMYFELVAIEAPADEALNRRGRHAASSVRHGAWTTN